VTLDERADAAILAALKSYHSTFATDIVKRPEQLCERVRRALHNRGVAFDSRQPVAHLVIQGPPELVDPVIVAATDNGWFIDDEAPLPRAEVVGPAPRVVTLARYVEDDGFTL
jgi:hypothetical protein